MIRAGGARLTCCLLLRPHPPLTVPHHPLMIMACTVVVRRGPAIILERIGTHPEATRAEGEPFLDSIVHNIRAQICLFLLLAHSPSPLLPLLVVIRPHHTHVISTSSHPGVLPDPQQPQGKHTAQPFRDEGDGTTSMRRTRMHSDRKSRHHRTILMILSIIDQQLQSPLRVRPRGLRGL